MAGRVKVLVVSDYAWPSGGTEHFVCQLLTRGGARFDMHLLTWHPGVLTPDGFKDVQFVENGDVRPLLAAMGRADVLVVVTSFNVRLLARLAAEYIADSGIPAVVVVQTSGHSDPAAVSVARQDRWLTHLMLSSGATVAVSDAVRHGLEALVGDRGTEVRIETIENAARLTTDERAARERRRVSFIGRPFAQKGYPLFARLADELSESGLVFRANTVTTEPDPPHPRIEYSWLLSDVDLLDFFATTDLLIAPYIRADGLPLALLEAINCGVPVLGFDSPAVGPLLRRYHQLVIPANYDALRRALERWARGDLPSPPTRVGGVPGWSEQIAKYLALIQLVAEDA